MTTVLVTGAAGFIGFHLCERLIDCGNAVVGIDNLNDYYDVSLKTSRLHKLAKNSAFTFHRIDIADRDGMAMLFSSQQFDIVVNLAAQPGVRYSLINPHAYAESNILGFLNVLEGCRQRKVSHLVFASSSSVYGENNVAPFSEHDNTDHPLSLYAATKKANEMMAHSYAGLYGLPSTGLRFFTVYGPWGRPDMAYFLFTKAIIEGKPLQLFNNGNMRRDFTYIDDIIEGIVRVMGTIPKPNPDGDPRDPASSDVPWRIYNIGNNTTIELSRFIEVLEDCIGEKAIINPLPMQPGDVRATCADVGDLMRDTGFRPRTPIEEGLKKFVEWYRWFYSTTRSGSSRKGRGSAAYSGKTHGISTKANDCRGHRKRSATSSRYSRPPSRQEFQDKTNRHEEKR